MIIVFASPLETEILGPPWSLQKFKPPQQLGQNLTIRAPTNTGPEPNLAASIDLYLKKITYVYIYIDTHMYLCMYVCINLHAYLWYTHIYIYVCL